MLKRPEKSITFDENFELNDCVQCDLTNVNIIRKSAILRNSDVNAYYRNIFDSCDSNKDGLINISELKEFLANQEEDEIPEDVIKTLHSCFDQNKDEQLDFYEFLDLINHPTVGRTFKRVGSRYLKFVVLSSIRKKSLKLRRTLTDTGLYEEEIVFSIKTIGMLLLSAVQIILFYIDKTHVFPKSIEEIRQFNPKCMDPTLENYRKPIDEALQFNPCHRNEIWRFLTYILLHNKLDFLGRLLFIVDRLPMFLKNIYDLHKKDFDLNPGLYMYLMSSYHLYSNVIIQSLVGVPLELVHHWRVPVIYVLGAFGGCLAHSVVSPTATLVGGSGGLYALYTAHIATVILNWREMSHPVVHLILFGILTVFDAILNYYMVVVAMNKNPSTSYIAHLGGAVVGLLLGLTILRNLKVTKTEKIVWHTSGIVLIVLLTIFLTLNVSVDMLENRNA